MSILKPCDNCGEVSQCKAVLCMGELVHYLCQHCEVDESGRDWVAVEFEESYPITIKPREE